MPLSHTIPSDDDDDDDDDDDEDDDLVQNTATLLTAVNETFLPFSRHKLRMIALLVFLQIEMTDFPTLSYTATNKIPTLSYICSLRKVYPFRAEPPRIGHYRSTSRAVAFTQERTFYPIYSPVSSQFIVFRFFRFLCRVARRTVLAVTLRKFSI